MAFHIPFNQRRRRQYRPAPVYIGFDVPAQRPKRKFNWWGFNGLMLSLGSFLTAGFASPVALLVSLVGMRKSKGPRKAAAAGTAFSLLGIALASAIVLTAVGEHRQRAYDHAAHTYNVKISKDMKVLDKSMVVAKAELVEYREANGMLPEPIFGNMLTIKHQDPWGTPLRYEDDLNKAIIRSAGPDARFDNHDDVVVAVKGKVEAISSPLDEVEKSMDSGIGKVSTSDSDIALEVEIEKATPAEKVSKRKSKRSGYSKH